MTWLIGIDEVGRGPLAGPVMVGVAAMPTDFDWTLIPGVTDSKKLTEKRREVIYEKAQQLQHEEKLFFAVVGESAQVIDEMGIVPAITSALVQALEEVVKKVNSGPSPRVPLGYTDFLVKLDGGLKAPVEFLNQETIIKGDANESVIGLASIVAKVTRDREMVRLAAQFPEYELEVHKGYGTKAHCEAVRRLGLCALHRQTFCRNLITYN